MTGSSEDRVHRAKQLFFDSDGSHFFMSRDGTDAEYDAYGIERAVEAEWLQEIIDHKLKALGAHHNWRVVHFLRHHRLLEHLNAILFVEPQGEPWEQCAFLEELWQYVREGRRGIVPEDVARATQYIQNWCARLLELQPDAPIQDRVRVLLASVTRRGWKATQLNQVRWRLIRWGP